MKVLIACEFSGIVRDAFAARGHDAWSCDLLPSERPGQHIQDDVLGILNSDWDLMIAFPPCTHLAVSGARWFKEKIDDGRQQEGINFFLEFTKTNIPKWCIENPVSIMSRYYRKPNQVINPFYFGDAVPKKTCLWLNALPPLVHSQAGDLFQPATHVKPDYMKKKNGEYYRDAKGKLYSEIHFMSRSNPDRAKLRSKTFPGIAKAMAQQWG